MVSQPLPPDGLRSVRESFGFTQTEFARLLRIHRNTWGKWERGEQDPPAILGTTLALLIHMRQHSPATLMEWIAESD